jgi:hypothetical protein
MVVTLLTGDLDRIYRRNFERGIFKHDVFFNQVQTQTCKWYHEGNFYFIWHSLQIGFFFFICMIM